MYFMFFIMQVIIATKVVKVSNSAILIYIVLSAYCLLQHGFK